MAERSRDGRRRVDPPCEFGHTFQAMECPSCAELLCNEKTSPAWWAWYRRRNAKKPKSGEE